MSDERRDKLDEAFSLLVRSYKAINKLEYEDGESWEAVSPDVHWFISEGCGDSNWLNRDKVKLKEQRNADTRQTQG